MITVQGTLRDPLGKELVGAVIRFTAITSEGDTFKGIDAEAITDQDGSYDFELQLGRYRLEVLHTDEYHESGTVLVDGNTPSPLTLVQLWAYTSPLNPPLLNPNKPVWDELYQDVLKGDEWEREAEEQVRDTTVLVNEDKSIHKKGDAYLAKETLTTGTQDVTQTTQTTTYKDEYAQEASVSSQENTTRNAKASESLGAYTHSDGSTEVQKRVELIGSIGSTTEIRTEDTDTLDKVKGVRSTHLEESAGSTVSKYKHGDNEVSTTTAVQYMDADKFVQALIEQNVKLTYSNNGFPVEAFNRLLVGPWGSTNTIQADKHIIQAVDGFPVATFDTANREIIFDSKLTFQNTDDFIGEEGWSYDWDFEYSNDQLVWKPDYTFGDIWRKERKFKFKEADPEGTKQYIGEAIIVQLNAKDGLDGDNYYLEYEYTTAQAYPSGWRPNFVSGDDWRRWRSVRITPTGTEISKWQEEPMKGTDGPEGWIPEYQIFYGPDATKPLYTDQDHDGSLDDINLAHWHQNMSEGDLYKFERKVWWKSQADFTASRTDLSMVPHVLEPWNGPIKIMPVAGEDYGDRFASLYLYKRAATKPSDALGVWRYNFDSLTLEPVNGNFLGWSTSVVDGLEHLWVATATAHSLTNVDDHIDNWDVDKLASNGLKNATAELYQVTAGTVTSVALPTNVINYSFSQGKVSGTPNNGWQVTPPNNTVASGKLWRTFAPVTADAFVDLEPIAANDWETATVISQNGSNGTNGQNGLNSVLVHLYKRASSAGSLPSTTSTYTFSTKTLTGFNNGWSTTIPTGSGTIWVTVATASSIGDTDTIAANEWATAAQFSENGISVTGVTNYYAKHSSNTTYPTIGSASWTTSVPTVDATNKYLWNYETIAYSSGSPTNTPPAVIGVFGEKGIKSITEYYLLSNASTGVTNATGSWVTTPSVTTPTNRYLWNYELITYTDNSTTKTAAVVIGVHGENGAAGYSSAILMVYQRTTGTPSVPSTTATYTFATGVLTGLNNGWTTTIPTGTAPVWVTTASALSNTATDSIAPSEWATPVILAQSGTDGKHGSGTYVVTVANVASIPNDAGKDNHVVQLSGRAAQSGDILTYKDSGKTFSKSYLRGASTWSEFEFVFDGSAIVNGTLAAEALKSGTSITDTLYISSTKSNAEMTLAGTGDYRMWLGSNAAYGAPFSVDKYGNLIANKATIKGAVTATSGSFTGTVNASSGSFTGTVNANAGTFNNVTIAENCNVLGTVYAERIVGDVTSLLLHQGNFNIAAWTKRRTLTLVQGGVVFEQRVSGSGTLGLVIDVKVNGVTVESFSNGLTATTGGDFMIKVTCQPYVTIPPNTAAAITYTSRASGSGSLTGALTNLTTRAVWLLAVG